MCERISWDSGGGGGGGGGNVLKIFFYFLYVYTKSDLLSPKIKL